MLLFQPLHRRGGLAHELSDRPTKQLPTDAPDRSPEIEKERTRGGRTFPARQVRVLDVGTTHPKINILRHHNGVNQIWHHEGDQPWGRGGEFEVGRGGHEDEDQTKTELSGREDLFVSMRFKMPTSENPLRTTPRPPPTHQRHAKQQIIDEIQRPEAEP